MEVAVWVGSGLAEAVFPGVSVAVWVGSGVGEFLENGLLSLMNKKYAPASKTTEKSAKISIAYF